MNFCPAIPIVNPKSFAPPARFQKHAFLFLALLLCWIPRPVLGLEPGRVVTWAALGVIETVPSTVSNAVDVAAGVNFSIALNANGSVVVWSQQGPPPPPVPVAARANVIAVAAGSYHALALKNDGSVVAWAIANDVGQATVPPGLPRVRAVAAGNLHSLALLENGTVVAWGSNGSGELSVPPGLNSVTAIAAGGNHSLALLTNGVVVAWGRNDYGQASVPAGIGPVDSIAAGDLHSAAVIRGGTVVAWGANGAGQTNVPAGLPAIRSVAAGRDHTLAVTTGGEVRAWGQLYDGMIHVPVRIPSGLNSISKVAAGQFHSVALGGEFSRPPSIQQHPTNVTARLGEPVRFSVIAAGADVLAYQWRKDGVIIPGATGSEYVFNVVETNQAGGYSVIVSTPEGQATNSLTAILTVVAVPGVEIESTVVGWGILNTNSSMLQHSTNSIEALDNVVSISCGEGFLVGLTTDGRVKAWPPGLASTDVPAGLSNVIALDSGYRFTLALRQNGSMVAWGDNSEGQANIPSPLGPLSAVSAGDFHSVVLRTNGTVVAWGNNAWGQTVPPAGLDHIMAISAGGYHTLALRDDGRVFAWGLNDEGQSTVPTAALTGVVAIAAGRNHSLALKADGTVVGWGSNTPPQGGESTPPAGLAGVRAIAAGHYFSVALLADGTVLEWGSGIAGTRSRGPASAICAGSRQYAGVVDRPSGYPRFTVGLPPTEDFVIGQTARLTAGITGLQPLRYQWRFEGADISGATNSWLDLAVTRPGQAGSYTLAVLNRFGLYVSEPVRVGVYPDSGPEVYLWDYDGRRQVLQPFLRGVRSVVQGTAFYDLDRAGGYAVKTNGTVVAWDQYGEASSDSNRVAALRDVISLATGRTHTLVLHKNGTVSALGNPLANNPASVARAIAVPPGLSNVTSVAAGTYFSLALTAEGKVHVWGSQSAPAGLSNVVSLDVLDSKWAAIRRDGTVFSSSESLGIPAGVSGIVDISIAPRWVAAVKTDGSLVLWGYSLDFPNEPVPSGNDFVAVSVGNMDSYDLYGSSFGVALRRNGTLVAWGKQYYGGMVTHAATVPPLPAPVVDFDTRGSSGQTVALVRRTVEPVLGLSPGPGGLILEWAAAPGGFVLQSSVSLQPAVWSAFGGIPSPVEGTNRWPVLPDEPARFFRLFRP